MGTTSALRLRCAAAFFASMLALDQAANARIERREPLPRPVPAAVIEGVEFYEQEDVALARQLAEEARTAAQNCDRNAYEAAIDKMRNEDTKFLVGMFAARKRAELYYALGMELQAEYMASLADWSASRSASWGRLVRHFQRTREERFKHCKQSDSGQRGFVPGIEPLRPGEPRDALGSYAALPATAFGPFAGFYAQVDGGVQRVNWPAARFFRSDSGGQFGRFPTLKFDNDDTVGVFRGMIGYRFPTPNLIKERSSLGIELHGWYYGGSSRGSQSQFVPAPGETTGLFSPATPQFPFGGYGTGQPLSDISYKSDYRNYGGEMRLQRWCDYPLDSGGDVVLEPWIGFRLGRTTVDQSLNLGIGNPVFTSFSQSSDIGSTFFGPTLGVGVRYEFGNGLFVFGKAGASLDFQRGEGHWSTIVPFVDGPNARAAKLSNNKATWSVGGSLGVGYRWESLELRASFDASHSNGSPYLKFADPASTTSGSGGAKIGYGNQTNYGGALGLRMNF
jgi:hypothetical protein